MKESVRLNGIKYEWLGQSTMRITGKNGFTIYTDPVVLDKDPAKAGLILVSHHHVDHCLPEFIKAITDERTKSAAFHESYIKYCVADLKGVRTVRIGQTIELAGAAITGVEAYTKRGFHSRGEGCGFLIEFQGSRIYFSGDSAPTEEMKGLSGIDAAVMAVCDNIHGIEPSEIAAAVKEIRPKLFIPVHFTPPDEPEAQLTGEIFLSKDPRFFTRKFDPKELLPFFKDTGIEVGILKKLG